MADPLTEAEEAVAEKVRLAITTWGADAGDAGDAWRHAGQSSPDGNCAAWAEGLNCCIDPDHPDFEALVGAISKAVVTS